MPVSPFLVAMRGTERAPPRCVALAGEIGGETACTIYAVRPSPCRAVVPSYRDGVPDDKCDAARRAHGLAPLSPADWAPLEDDPGRHPPRAPPRRRVA